MAQHDENIKHSSLTVSYKGRKHQLQYFDRPAPGRTILYVHGLGCSKTDFLHMTHHPQLDPFRLVSYDHPGCGGSPYDPDNKLGIDDLVELLDAFVEKMALKDFLLVGGSMGGLVVLLYAQRHPSKIRGLVSIEGNLAPEDCMFSRQTATSDYQSFVDVVYPEIKTALANRNNVVGFSRHLEGLAKANPHAYHDYSKQTVDYSDNGKLLERFLTLPMPKCFVYGSENRHLSYLSRLRQSDCAVIEIPNADHFLFYDNPGALATELANIALEISR